MAWRITDGELTNSEFPESAVFSQPFPVASWRVTDGELSTGILPETEKLGAFCYAENLRKVTIPKSVKYIGEYAFRNTALTEVTIASDCTYYPTSFPDNCKINYYDGEETSNFITADGYEIITADGLIFYAKEE